MRVKTQGDVTGHPLLNMEIYNTAMGVSAIRLLTLPITCHVWRLTILALLLSTLALNIPASVLASV